MATAATLTSGRDEHRARHRGQWCDPLEVQQDASVSVIKARIGKIEPVDKGLCCGGVVARVDAEELHAVGGARLGCPGHRRSLGATGPAPGAPDVHHQDLAAEVGRRQWPSFQVGSAERREGGAVVLGVEGQASRGPRAGAAGARCRTSHHRDDDQARNEGGDGECQEDDGAPTPVDRGHDAVRLLSTLVDAGSGCVASPTPRRVTRILHAMMIRSSPATAIVASCDLTAVAARPAAMSGAQPPTFGWGARREADPV
jgi:hypothetical protein